jgi:hypothetical protein
MRDVLSHPWEAATVALAGVALLWQVVVALVLPPFAYDALTYHLTIAATWVQQGDLTPTPLSLCCAWYPASPELLTAWPMLLQGSDVLVGLVQIPFVLLGAAAVAGAARTCALSRSASAAAGALFAVTPAVLAQSPTQYSDVMLTGLVLAALHSLLRFAATADVRRLVVACLAIGLVLGTKGTGALWAAALTVTAGLLSILLIRRGRLAPRLGALAGSAGLLAVTVTGGWWYSRNWVVMGNPLYPFAVAGRTLFAGPFEVSEVLTVPPAGAGDAWPVALVRSWLADAPFWNQGSYDYQQRLGGLGPLWLYLGLPLLLPYALASWRRRSPALMLIAVNAAVLLLQPYRWWARFTLPLAALGALAVAASSAWRRPAGRRAVKALALALATCGVVLASYEVDPASRAQPLRSTEVLQLVGSPAQERTVGRLFFPEYRFLEQIPQDAVIVVDLRAPAVRFVYPLFGRRLSRTVLPANATPPPPSAWLVTGLGRDLDVRAEGDPRRTLAFQAGDLRVWRPAPSPS